MKMGSREAQLRAMRENRSSKFLELKANPPSTEIAVVARGGLVKYEAMCRAIEDAHAVDEVINIRDQAAALEAYAKQALNTDNERKAAEVRLRAERKVGQLRAAETRATGNLRRGSRLDPKGPPGEKGPPTNAERREQLGISEKQDKQWQQLGALSQEEFDVAIGVAETPSTKGILRATAEPAPRQTVSDEALWLWGRLKDFKRDGLLAKNPIELIETMTEPMKDDVHELAPQVVAWLKRIGEVAS